MFCIVVMIDIDRAILGQKIVKRGDTYMTSTLRRGGRVRKK